MAAYDFPDTAGKPTDGSFDYTAPDGTLYEWNGYAWVVPTDESGGGSGGAARVLTQVLPPSPAEDGDMYWCTDDGRLYLYYDDADTKQWVDASPDGGGNNVEKLIAGDNITLSPANGKGVVTINSTGGGGGTSTPQKVAILADVKPTDTEGGPSVSGWQDRTLNTIQSDTGNLVTLANDKEFTLKAGTYLIEWSAPAFKIERHQTKLTNITTGSTEQLGSSEYSPVTNTDQPNPTQSRSFGSARVNITSDTTYKIEHFCTQVRVTNALGVRTVSGDENIYTQVAITDLSSGGSGGSGGGGGTTVNYNGASAWGHVAADGTLKGGLNSAVTKLSTGAYRVTFTKPLPNNTYSVTATPSMDTSNSQGVVIGFSNKTSTSFDVNTRATTTNGAGASNDREFSFAVHSENAIAPQYGVGADAWCLFNGQGGFPNADRITNGYNINTITRTATGTYDITFITPMPTADYAVVSPNGILSPATSRTTTGFSFVVRAQNDNNNVGDSSTINLAVYASSTVTPTYTWTRDVTTLKPANDGDDVDLGNIQLNADGSVTAAGVISSGAVDGSNALAQGSRILNGGRLDIQRASTADATSGLIQGYYGTDRTFSLKANGSAEFAGSVTSNGKVLTRNVELQLEADDDTKYTAATNEDGEQTLVYNGATLDVKALLLNLQTAAARITTLEETNASLEARLTALEGGNN